jgi:hypothetical protein
MNTFQKALLVKTIAAAAALAAISLCAPGVSHAAGVGGPLAGMVCPSGYTPNFNGTSLKCSKISEIKVELACLQAPFTIKVVRVNAPGTPEGLDVCDKAGGVTVTSGNDITNFVKGSDYVFAKQDDAQIATKASNQRQTEATALGVPLGDVEVQIGTAVTDTTSGDSTDKSKVPLTFFTFAVRTGGLGPIGGATPVGSTVSTGSVGSSAAGTSTVPFAPKPLPR